MFLKKLTADSSDEMKEFESPLFILLVDSIGLGGFKIISNFTFAELDPLEIIKPIPVASWNSRRW